jgi:hypothetical protein
MCWKAIGQIIYFDVKTIYSSRFNFTFSYNNPLPPRSVMVPSLLSQRLHGSSPFFCQWLTFILMIVYIAVA